MYESNFITQHSVRKGGSTVLTVRVRYIIKAPLV